jgi:hypothetical protein
MRHARRRGTVFRRQQPEEAAMPADAPMTGEDVRTALWLARRVMRMRAGRAPWQSRFRR